MNYVTSFIVCLEQGLKLREVTGVEIEKLLLVFKRVSFLCVCLTLKEFFVVFSSNFFIFGLYNNF